MLVAQDFDAVCPLFSFLKTMVVIVRLAKCSHLDNDYADKDDEKQGRNEGQSSDKLAPASPFRLPFGLDGCHVILDVILGKQGFRMLFVVVFSIHVNA